MEASLLKILRSIPDRRRREGLRFDLATVLLYSILGHGRRGQFLPANA